MDTFWFRSFASASLSQYFFLHSTENEFRRFRLNILFALKTTSTWHTNVVPKRHANTQNCMNIFKLNSNLQSLWDSRYTLENGLENGNISSQPSALLLKHAAISALDYVTIRILAFNLTAAASKSYEEGSYGRFTVGAYVGVGAAMVWLLVPPLPATDSVESLSKGVAVLPRQ